MRLFCDACVLAVAVAAASCSFSGAPVGLSDGSPEDGARDGAARDGGIEFGAWETPELVSGVELDNGSQFDDPLLHTPNRVMWSITKPASERSWVADFNVETLEISNPEELDVNVITLQRATPWLSANELTYAFSDPGDIVYATRTAKGEPFQPGEGGWFDNINTQSVEALGSMSEDLREIVFARGDALGRRLFIARRQTTDDSFPEGTEISEISEIDRADEVPKLSPDGLVILFARRASASPADNDIFTAQRPTPSADFEDVMAIDELNTVDVNDSDATISADGRLMFFASGSPGALRIYAAKRQIISQSR